MIRFKKIKNLNCEAFPFKMWRTIRFSGYPLSSLDQVVVVDFKPPFAVAQNVGENQLVCAIADTKTEGLVEEVVSLATKCDNGANLNVRWDEYVPPKLVQEAIDGIRTYTGSHSVKVHYYPPKPK
ncbi:hypothetical protein HYY71_02330 [Candidatus Woesearchaeota archaeon]|nr:hypothetical protein [Candidatus Woesearchaeota archaeon]